MDAVRETANPQAMKAGPNPGVTSPTDHLLVRDSAGHRPEPSLATPFRVTQCSVARAPCYVLRRSALPAFLSRISPSWHFRPGEQAFHGDRANRSLPVQSQSHLSGIHPVRVRIVCLVEQLLASGNARSGCRLDRDGCDSTGGKVPRTQLQRPLFGLQGSGPPLVVRVDSPNSAGIDR
jgi:hypothetical protein